MCNLAFLRYASIENIVIIISTTSLTAITFTHNFSKTNIIYLICLVVPIIINVLCYHTFFIYFISRILNLFIAHTIHQPVIPVGKFSGGLNKSYPQKSRTNSMKLKTLWTEIWEAVVSKTILLHCCASPRANKSSHLDGPTVHDGACLM